MKPSTPSDSITRREFVRATSALAAAALAGGLSSTAQAADATATSSTRTAKPVGSASPRPFLTPSDKFRDVSRGNPKPHTLTGDALVRARLTPETWRLEITADDAPNPLIKDQAGLSKPRTLADGTALDKTRSWQLAGSYEFKVAKVFAHLGTIHDSGNQTTALDRTYKIWELSAAVPIEAGKLLIGYASRKTGDLVGPVPPTAPGGNLYRKVFTVGYDYFLSKRTDVYAIAMNDKTSTYTLPAPPRPLSASATSIGLGIRHGF